MQCRLSAERMTCQDLHSQKEVKIIVSTMQWHINKRNILSLHLQTAVLYLVYAACEAGRQHGSLAKTHLSPPGGLPALETKHTNLPPVLMVTCPIWPETALPSTPVEPEWHNLNKHHITKKSSGSQQNHNTLLEPLKTVLFKPLDWCKKTMKQLWYLRLSVICTL